MDVKFRLDDFEGPLDLLLHLIKESKMDIFEVEIESIIKQYLEYIEQLEKLNLDVASEYLVMASELIELKSKLLLPNKVVEEDELEDDPKEELLNRLLEYQTYKEVSKALKEKEELRKEIYTKAPEEFSKISSSNIKTDNDTTLDDLMSAFEKFLVRKQESKPLSTKITTKEISIATRRREIKQLLSKQKRISFFKLFDVITKEYIVATFLAILEMAKNNELKIVQDKLFDDIMCEVESGK